MNRRVVLVLLVGLLGGSVFVSGRQPAQAGPDYVPGEILLQFRAIAPPFRRASILAAQGATEIRRFDAVDISLIRLAPGRDTLAVLAALRGTSEVAVADLNYINTIVASTAPNDPFWLDGTLWGLTKISAENAWTTFSTGSSSVVVADIDTGVNYLHPDLAANMWTNPGEIPGNGIDDDSNGYVDDVHGIDARNNDGDPMDDHGHGTHTSGTIAGAGNNGIGVVGVSWNAKILACKFLDASGSGNDGDAIECFNYLINQKARGINIGVTSNSWGRLRGGGGDGGPLRDAIDAAGNAGILSVFAAGNNGVDTDASPFDPASYSSASIVSVAASDPSDVRAGFSNYGATSVDLAAPGVGIVSTYGSGYGSASGTSMATPHVAGAAALMSGLAPQLSVSALKAALIAGVDHLPEWSGKVVSGGRLNLFLAAAAATGNMPPAVALTAPASEAQFTPPATVSLAADATDSDGWITSVEFFANGASLGVDATSPYTWQWNNVAAGTYTITAVATDDDGLTSTSAGRTIHVIPAGGSIATALAVDTTTQGNWLGQYGQDGYAVVGDTTSYPAYAQVTVSGASTYVWTTSTADPRALQRSSGSGRVMAAWYNTGFDITVRLTDGQPHRLAIYNLDWDPWGRAQRIDAYDADSGQLLATQSLSGYSGGQYVVWRLTGHIRFHVTATAGPNAVVSGLFFDPDGAPVNTPPSVSLTAPADGASFPAGSNITVSATASDTDGTVTSVQFFANGAAIGTSPNPFSLTWPAVPAGTYTLTAVATDDDGATRTSASRSIVVNPAAGGGASATVLSLDPTTQGNWLGQYGGDGYAVVGDTTSYPAYAQVTVSGASTYVWTTATTDPRALQRSSGSGRVMAAWYNTGFDITVRLTDGQPHRLAIYNLDWDPWGRAQRIDAYDADSGQLLASQSLSGYSGGQYVVWRLTGHIRFHVTGTAGPNAVVSGLFFDPDGAPVNNPPSVSLTAPADGASFPAGSNITVSATASDTDGTVTSVQFFANGAAIGTSPNPFSLTWPAVPAGTYTLTAVATDDDGATRTSASRSIVVNPAAGGGASATVLSLDPTTQGNWLGQYGGDGYAGVGDTTSYPAYAQVTVSGASTYVWTTATTDPRALQRSSGSGRVMAAWYNTGFDITVRLTDGQPHRLAIYNLDWDPWGRAQRIDAYDADSGQLLATQSLSGYSGGQYVVWRLTGHIRFHVTATAGPNAVVSGLFFDPDGAPVNTPPSVSLTAPADGASFPAGSNITVSATASDTDGTVTSVQFFANGAAIGTSPNPFSLTWPAVPAGTYTLTAVATDDDGATRTSASRSIVVNPAAGGGASATVLSLDPTTQGNWLGQYGGDGYAVVGDTTSYPAYAQVTLSGASTYVWTTATTDPRALQRSSGSGRVMAAWYNTGFDITVRLTDGQPHRLAIYNLDWDPWGRAQRIDAYDADSGQLLATQSLSGYSGGQYVVWRLTGHIRFHVTGTAGPNAVVSGLFFHPDLD